MAALPVLGERRFEAFEVPLQQQLQRAAADPCLGRRLFACSAGHSNRMAASNSIGPSVILPFRACHPATIQFHFYIGLTLPHRGDI